MSLTHFFLYVNLPFFSRFFFNYMCKYLFHSIISVFIFRCFITHTFTLLCLAYKFLTFSPILLQLFIHFIISLIIICFLISVFYISNPVSHHICSFCDSTSFSFVTDFIALHFLISLVIPTHTSLFLFSHYFIPTAYFLSIIFLFKIDYFF